MILEVDLVLPFLIPVKDNSKLVSDYCFGDLVVEFSSFAAKPEQDYENIIPSKSKLSIKCVANEELESYSGTEHFLYIFMVQLIKYVNHFIMATKIEYHIPYLRSITVTDLASPLVIVVDNMPKLYMTATLESLGLEKFIDAEKLAKIGSRMTSMELHPTLSAVDEFYQSSIAFWYQENFAAAIVNLETSFEIFVRNAMRLILLKEGANEEEITKYNNCPFRNVIEQHLSKYLHTELSFEKNPIINQWYEHVYSPRNSFVHSGDSRIYGNEVYTAMQSYAEARNYLSDLLSDNGYLDKEKRLNRNVFPAELTTTKEPELVISRLQKEGLLPEGMFIEKCE